MPPRLYRIILPVSDIQRAERFYHQVLGVRGRYVSPGRRYFDCGGTILACFDPRADGDGYQARPIPEWVYLSVDDLAATLQACRAAGAQPSEEVIHGAPAAEIGDRPWGERSFYVRDPFGNGLCFVQRGTEYFGEPNQ